MKTYVGHRDGFTVTVEEPGQPVTKLPWRTDVTNHSPTGFAWGYGGSGPAQLALAILIDALGSVDRAKALHQSFKHKVVAQMPRDVPHEWRLAIDDVLLHVGQIEAERESAL